MHKELNKIIELVINVIKKIKQDDVKSTGGRGEWNALGSSREGS